MQSRNNFQNGVLLACALAFGNTGGVQAQSPTYVRPEMRPAVSYDRPSISPYLQLLNAQPSGLSNYQTLVRPLIEEREARIRQGMSLQRLQRQTNQAMSASEGAAPSTRAQHMPRRMYFSHFYPSITVKTSPDAITTQR